VLVCEKDEYFVEFGIKNISIEIKIISKGSLIFPRGTSQLSNILVYNLGVSRKLKL